MIIDEIDNLTQFESARSFITFLQNILKSDTNTSIIGIANSVDPISKLCEAGKKERELVQRKLVFSPYNEQQIRTVISQKRDDCWGKCEEILGDFPEIREKLEGLVTPDALMFIARKVSKMSGDIRVAFDVIKGALVKKLKLASDTLEADSEADLLERGEIRSLQIQDIQKIFKDKHETKLAETIKSLPPLTASLLKTLVSMVKSPEQVVGFDRLVGSQRMQARAIGMPAQSPAEIKECLSQLESYGIITNEQTPKAHKIGLKADFEETTEICGALEVF